MKHENVDEHHPTEAPTLAYALARPASPAEGLPREIGGFRILRKPGEGGMGIVYEAEQRNTSRLVALKVVRGGHFVDEMYLKMFRREVESLARLAHPPSTLSELRKLVVRHRGSVAAAGAIAVLLLALAVTMTVQAGRVRRERDRAASEAAKASAINTFLLDALGAADP